MSAGKPYGMGGLGDVDTPKMSPPRDRIGATNEDGPEGATNTPGPSRRNVEGDVD